MVATLTRPNTTEQAHADRAAQLARIEARLEKGWELLEQGSNNPAEMARWEDSWLRMLRQYEALYDAA